MIFAERDAGDPAMIVANPDLARRELGWTHEFNHLKGTIARALDRERHMMRESSAL
ncbi:hypothetical protein [Rhizobium rhizosphaerae]|uniref:hypothetical protein n=1 Tax=Xaviernesmea rhizosphaerae TaxID=1672749 RepID=UPI000A5EA035|nr:hypothetical protein [Xaviernesmea rhizosphaerae]